jgi:hypothetical protein
VTREPCGSSEFSVVEVVFEALYVGDPETYPVWARSWLAPKKVARESIKTSKIDFVYFMPRESLFFTINRASNTLLSYSMHATGRNRDHAAGAI